MKRFFISALALLGMGICATAQEKVTVHNGSESYVTNVEYITFDASDADEAVSVSALQTEITTLTGEKTTLEGQVSTLTSEKAELATAKTTLEGQVSTLTSEKAELATAKTTLEGQVSTLTSEKAELATAKTTLEGQVSTLTSEKAELATAKTTLEGQVSTLTSEKTALETKVKSMEYALGERSKVHEYVDLGLTSGTLWATMNVGASKPEDYGDHFAWGETFPKSNYSWSTYKYMDRSKDPWEGCTKYTFDDGQTSGVWYDSEGQFIGDNKTELDDADDVAVQTWGGAWKMPTKTQQDELRNECDWEWTSINGVNGYKVKSRVNSNFIFLPAAGGRWDADLSIAGNYGLYWSRSLGTNDSVEACNLYFDSSYVDWGVNGRGNSGCSVRPVCLPAAEP